MHLKLLELRGSRHQHQTHRRRPSCKMWDFEMFVGDEVVQVAPRPEARHFVSLTSKAPQSPASFMDCPLSSINGTGLLLLLNLSKSSDNSRVVSIYSIPEGRRIRGKDAKC